MRDRLEYFFFQLLVTFVRLFSFRTVQKTGGMFGTYIFSVIGFRKKLVLDNLRNSFPEKNENEIHAIAKASYKNLFTAFFEIFYLDKLSADDFKNVVTFPDAHKIPEALEGGKGLILLTGHYGSWEMAALATSVIEPQKYTVVVQKQRNIYVDAFMTLMRTRFGTKLVGMDKALRESLRALKNNEAIALIADQSGPENGVYVNFFGRPASTHQGPAVFQVRSGAPMMLLVLIRVGDGKFKMELEEIDTTNLIGTDEEKIYTITQRHVSVLEKYIRLHPEQWLWMHKRWKHTESFLRKQSESLKT